MAAPSPSHFERLGGEPALRAIIDAFIDRVVSDAMIGFFFRQVNVARLKELEYQHAAELLGADVVYRGRALDEAHRKHPIMGGQFARRTTILRETLEAHEVPVDVRDAWLAHVEALRPLITRDADSDCDPDDALARTREPDSR